MRLNMLAKAGINPNVIGKQAAFTYFEELTQAVLISALGGEINKLLSGIITYLPK